MIAQFSRIATFMGLWFCFSSSVAQTNLVPNGSFEEITSCFYNFNPPCDFNFSCTANIQFARWCNVTHMTSPDLFSITPIDPSYWPWQAPSTQFSYQFPRTGQAFAGIVGGIYLPPGTGYEEQMTRSLQDTLEAGKKYCVEFYCSPATVGKLFMQRMEAIFTPDSLRLMPGGQAPFSGLNPQVQNNTLFNPIIDTGGWTPVRGAFIAQGNEYFISIGHFRPLLPLNPWDTIRHNIGWLGGGLPIDGLSYYMFIDDVSVTELKALHSKDTLVCSAQGFPAQIKAYPGFDSYLWNTGDTSRIIHIQGPGNYWVTASGWCGSVTDTISVGILNDSLFVPQQQDLFPCASHLPITIEAPWWARSAIWSNGDTALSTTLSQAGTYTLQTFDGCFFKTDTFQVSIFQNPSLTLGNDTNVCGSGSLTLYAPQGFTYQWSNGSNLDSLVITQNGFYSLSITDSNGCDASDGQWVMFYETQDYLISLGNDTGFCESQNGLNILIPHNIAGFDYVLWNQDTISAALQWVNTPGTYIASGQHVCGLFSDTIQISRYPLPMPDLGKDTVICLGASISLYPGAFAEYLWSNGSVWSEWEVNQAGIYSVLVTDSVGCQNQDQINIGIENQILDLLPADTTIASIDLPFTLSSLQLLDQYQWSNGSSATEIQITEEGKYLLEGRTKEDCWVRDEIYIRVIDLKPLPDEMFIPSVIARNQALRIGNLKPNTSIRVYNALGQLVYLETQYRNQWVPQVASAIYVVELYHEETGSIRERVRVE